MKITKFPKETYTSNWEVVDLTNIYKSKLNVGNYVLAIKKIKKETRRICRHAKSVS